MVLSVLLTRMSKVQVSSLTRCENFPYIREFGAGGGDGDTRGSGSIRVKRLLYWDP